MIESLIKLGATLLEKVALGEIAREEAERQMRIGIAQLLERSAKSDKETADLDAATDARVEGGAPTMSAPALDKPASGFIGDDGKPL